MTDLTSPQADRAVFGHFGARRPRAFDVAGRHTQRVRFFRRAIAVVCMSAVALIGCVSMFDPLGRLKLGLSIGSVGLNGTKVTMHDSKLSGVRKDGRAYEVKAATATQDTTATAVVDLTGVDLRLGQSDGSTTIVTAKAGRYDTGRDRLDLASAVRFLNAGRYDMQLEDAAIDMREGRISTDKPAVVVVPNGRFEADSLTFSEAAQTVNFVGRVHSTFNSDAVK